MNATKEEAKRRGLFVVFEGIDGSGKSTQIGRLSDYVRAQDKYQDVLLTREPTWRATELKDKLKGDSDAFSDARLMARLFVEDRKIHAYSQILPVLKERCFVICDRYTMSTLAYQSAQGEDMRALIQLHRDAKITAPDLTFYVNVSNATAAKRRILPDATFHSLLVAKLVNIVMLQGKKAIAEKSEITSSNNNSNNDYNSNSSNNNPWMNDPVISKATRVTHEFASDSFALDAMTREAKSMNKKKE